MALENWKIIISLAYRLREANLALAHECQRVQTQNLDILFSFLSCLRIAFLTLKYPIV